MTPDPESSVLEQALRGDLPSQEQEARLRRRFLAAGVVLSQGIAASTAAAAAPAPASFAAVVTSKVAALSWGAKLAIAAAVAVPTLAAPQWLAKSPSADAGAAAGAQRQSGASEQRQTPEVSAPWAPASPHFKLPEQPALAPEAGPPPARKPGDSPATPTAPENGQAPHLAAENDARFESAVARPSVAEFAPAEASPASANDTARVASSLAEETRLLDRAFSELATGNTARAGELIREHEQRFPVGLLQKERERARTKLNEISRGD